eukprot:9816085-Ditylum_brightwellii.AAC.1
MVINGISIISGVTVNNSNEHTKPTSIIVELALKPDNQTHDERSVMSAITNGESNEDNNEKEKEGSRTGNLKLNSDNKDNDN